MCLSCCSSNLVHFYVPLSTFSSKSISRYLCTYRTVLLGTYTYDPPRSAFLPQDDIAHFIVHRHHIVFEFSAIKFNGIKLTPLPLRNICIKMTHNTSQACSMFASHFKIYLLMNVLVSVLQQHRYYKRNRSNLGRTLLLLPIGTDDGFILLIN